MQELELVARDASRAPTAHKFHAPVLAHFGAAAHQDNSDLRRVPHVGAATGLQIRPFNFNGAENTYALHFLTDAEFGELLGGAVAHGNRAILGDDLVRRTFGAFQNFRRRLRAAQVDGANIGAQVERNGRASVTLLKHGREQVLTGVLLHVVEAASPIDAARDGAERKFAIDNVKDVFAIVADLDDVGLAELAQVVRLTAGLRI